MSHFEIDLQRGTLSVQSGQSQTRSLSLPPQLVGEASGIQSITRISAWPDAGQLRLTLTTGDHIDVELHREHASIDELRDGRPIVYLDQNHWSTLAAARFEHRPVPRAVADAAAQLIEWADTGRILLPASSAHFAETVPLHGTSRVATATAILQVSRGWQMRNPLHVRLDEIRRATAGRSPEAAEVFAPQADGFFSTRSHLGDQVVSGSPARVLAAVPAIVGLYDTLLETDPIPDEGALAEGKARAWAQQWALLAAELHANREAIAMVRRVANARMIADLLDDVDRAARMEGATHEQVITCLAGPEDPIARIPFLGQMRQMLFARLRNHTQRWEANDLTDILFLCCAAGYADVVAGERQAIGYLRQARMPRARAQLATTLEEAVSMLALDRRARRTEGGQAPAPDAFTTPPTPP